MTIVTGATDISLLVSRGTAVSACGILLLLGLGLHLALLTLGVLPRSLTLECDTAHDDGINIVSSKLIHCRQYSKISKKQEPVSEASQVRFSP